MGEKLNPEEQRTAILGWLDTLEAMIGKFREELGDKPKQTPQQAIDYDVEKIIWKDMPDKGKGPWQLADANDNASNADFLKFREAVKAGGDSTHTKTHFVWHMEGGALGRKLFVYCQRKK